MPNWTYTQIQIKGRKENVEECIKILDADYNYHDYKFSHTFHVFRTLVDNVEIDKYGMIACATIFCECAWSVYSCMFEGEYTYYNDRKGGYNRAITLQQMSKIYNVQIEVWSDETGMVFQEHYYIANGEIIIDEEYSSQNGFICACDYDSYEQYKNVFTGSNRLPQVTSKEEFDIIKKNNELFFEDPLDWQEWVFKDEMLTAKPIIDQRNEMITMVDNGKILNINGELLNK